ncbi:FecR family protein [Sphingomonas sp. M1-B02]|uniref:FecR family protein n=1 Tax=Sphingomonas sp. M1-B02 TaxID=3114300 RepID=UPI00223F46A4|nr:FecR domain-containing protein [Sphingomonas sp. S6-11]UZK67322.1 FecR domain-containing protein [Sphingomonas sp. S6-11]
MTDPRLIEAATWSERLAEAPGAITRARFAAWRRKPGSKEAWDSVAAARDTIAVLASHPELQALRDGLIDHDEPRFAARRRPLWVLAAAACVAAVAPLALWQLAGNPIAPPAQQALVYRTAPGKRLTVALPDGSRLTLNTASRVRVAYSDNERRLELDQGQGLFEVAKDAKRPFRVSSGGQTVTAHGTVFDVRHAADAVQVALVEGKVSVAAAGTARAAPVLLRPDDVLTATAKGVSVRHMPGRAEALASWTTGRLVFMDETLANAVAEMNRYGSSRIVVADSRAAQMRISGSFRIGDVRPFLEMLELGFPVRVERSADGTAHLSSRR